MRPLVPGNSLNGRTEIGFLISLNIEVGSFLSGKQIRKLSPVCADFGCDLLSSKTEG